MYLNETDIETLSIKAQRDLAFGIAAASTLEEALPLCLDIAMTVAGMDSGGIYLLDHSGDLVLACVKGVSDGFISEVAYLKADSDKATIVIERKPVYTKYEYLTDSLMSDNLKSEGLLAVAIIPVIYQDRLIACLNISSHTIQKIPPGSRNTLETIAAQIGNAIARIKAEEELREKQKELETLRFHLSELVAERTDELKSINMRFKKEIAERKQAEIALRESERNFRRLSEEYHILLDALPDTLLVLSGEMEILWVNTAAVFHLDEDTVLKRKCHSLFYNELKPCNNCPVVKSFSTGRSESSQVFTSNNRYLDVRARPIKDEYGHIAKIIVLARDMTEKVFLQREALRTSHLASIGELAAGVAHEINNPLTGIINYAQILANKSEKNSKNYDVCNRIIKEGDRIARIVKSLLSFARSTRQDKMPVEISQIFTDSIILTGARMNKDGITLHINISETLPKIMAEPNQLQQVFLNILSNARYALNKKYPSYDSNKIINVTCEEITADNKKFVRMIFHDNGCGVNASIIDKVFNPFFTTKPLGEGTGLGLSISYGIINEHKGHIVIDSGEGEFTRVIIDLPVWEGDYS
jgi:signal transduction histidine kinase